MAGRLLSRRALRDQHDQMESVQPEESVTVDDAPTTAEPVVKKSRQKKTTPAKPPKEKAPPKPRARKKAIKIPPRMVARWAVCDGGLKRVAVFEYRDRAGADAKLAEMHERKPGTFFLQLVKDPYDPPAPVDPVVAV